MAPQRQDLRARSFALAARLYDLYGDLASGDARHAHIARQLFRAVTSIAAQLEEAEVFASRRDLANKLSQALREARESHLWLRLISLEPGRASVVAAELQEVNELIAILTTSVKRLKADHEPA